jgi:hypothetical protein
METFFDHVIFLVTVFRAGVKEEDNNNFSTLEIFYFKGDTCHASFTRPLVVSTSTGVILTFFFVPWNRLFCFPT